MKGKKIITAVILVAIGAMVAAFGLRDTEPAKQRPDVQMVDSKNQPVTFEELKGKVLFVNNWASWCPPCVAEMPSIHELKTKLKGVDVEFIMVSFDEDKSKAHNFMIKRGYDFEIYFPGREYPFATSSIPATFIVDKSGRTVAEHTGMADYSDDEIVNELKKLAND